MAKQDDFIRTALRVPPELHRQIHAAAEAAGRTFNAEIVHRLESSLSPPAKQNDIDEAWVLVRNLNRQKDQLTAKLLSVQGQLLVLNDLIGRAMAGDDSIDDLQDLHQKRARARMELYSLEGHMARLMIDLDAAYNKVEGQMPPTGVRLTQADW